MSLPQPGGTKIQRLSHRVTGYCSEQAWDKKRLLCRNKTGIPAAPRSSRFTRKLLRPLPNLVAEESPPTADEGADRQALPPSGNRPNAHGGPGDGGQENKFLLRDAMWASQLCFTLIGTAADLRLRPHYSRRRLTLRRGLRGTRGGRRSRSFEGAGWRSFLLGQNRFWRQERECQE